MTKATLELQVSQLFKNLIIFKSACPSRFWYNTYHLMPLSHLQLNGLFEKLETLEEKEYLSVLGYVHCARLNGWTRFKVSLALVILLFTWRKQWAFGPDRHHLSTSERLTWNDLVSSHKALKSVTNPPRQNNILTKSDYNFCSGVTLDSFPLVSPRSHYQRNMLVRWLWYRDCRAVTYPYCIVG